MKADSLATLIYTSGTTGKPKGVELTHSNWTYEGAFVESLNIINIEDVQFLWLPLAHSFGKVLLSLQLQVGFVTAVDGRVPNIVDNLGGGEADVHGGGSRESTRRSTRASPRPHCPKAEPRPRSSLGPSRWGSKQQRRN
ncbi:MAG: AMP-binding protein [Candidatus Nanopelagicales bacterium]